MLAAGLRKSLGSNVLVNGSNSSFKKNSSGVLNSIPILLARSLEEYQASIIEIREWSVVGAYLSEHE